MRPSHQPLTEVSFWVCPLCITHLEGISSIPTGKRTCGLYQCQIPRYSPPTNPDTGSKWFQDTLFSACGRTRPYHSYTHSPWLQLSQRPFKGPTLKANGTAPTHTLTQSPSQATFTQTLLNSTLALEVLRRGQGTVPSVGIWEGLLLYMHHRLQCQKVPSEGSALVGHPGRSPTGSQKAGPSQESLAPV